VCGHFLETASSVLRSSAPSPSPVAADLGGIAPDTLRRVPTPLAVVATLLLFPFMYAGAPLLTLLIYGALCHRILVALAARLR
jgi:hypothetical protein